MLEFFFFFFFFKGYSFILRERERQEEREREREREGRSERGGYRESQAGSALTADVGLESTNHEIMT